MKNYWQKRLQTVINLEHNKQAVMDYDGKSFIPSNCEDYCVALKAMNISEVSNGQNQNVSG